VLDVAAGNGNATLAAARRFCDVVLDRLRPGAAGAGQGTLGGRPLAGRGSRWRMFEALPFRDESFDVVLSTFGVNVCTQPRAVPQARCCGSPSAAARSDGKLDARELRRPDLQDHGPVPATVRGPEVAPTLGTEEHLKMLFGDKNGMMVQRKALRVPVQVAQALAGDVQGFYGPMLKAFSALDGSIQSALETDLLALASRFNTAADGTMVLPSEYLEVVVQKK